MRHRFSSFVVLMTVKVSWTSMARNTPYFYYVSSLPKKKETSTAWRQSRFGCETLFHPPDDINVSCEIFEFCAFLKYVKYVSVLFGIFMADVEIFPINWKNISDTWGFWIIKKSSRNSKCIREMSTEHNSYPSHGNFRYWLAHEFQMKNVWYSYAYANEREISSYEGVFFMIEMSIWCLNIIKLYKISKH